MNQSTSNIIVGNDDLPLLVLINLFLININLNYLCPFVLPVLMVFALINNSLVILLLDKKAGISKSVRLYYIVIAVQDLFTLFSSHLWDFIGVVFLFLNVLYK